MSRLIILYSVGMMFVMNVAIAQAQDVTISEIVIEGAKRVSPSTVKSYMPVQVGDDISPVELNGIITSLFATDLFHDVQLRLDDDLAEAIALAHDLGHTPFGHAGETELDDAMRDVGGFDHNEQTIRILTKLEHCYADFDGLNLTWESLEGIVKHNGPVADPRPTVIALDQAFSLDLNSYASLEAQVAALSDD
ncbi:MAG: HD domain-containing protein, partial [Alphaproteobacteria bacterium]